MNLFDLDLKASMPNIIEIYVELFGEEYREIIENRIKNTKYVYYKTPSGITGYNAFLRCCKAKELGIKFLKRIGIEIDDEKEGSSADPYSDKTKQLLVDYLGNSYIITGFWNEEGSISGVKCFDESRQLKNGDDEFEQRYARRCQINMLNNLRGSSDITEDNYDEFKKTDEFEELKSKVEEYYKVYQDILAEYNDYISTLSAYSNFATTELTRRHEIAQKYDNDWKEHADDIYMEFIETSEDYIKHAKSFADERDCEKMKIVFNNQQVCVQELFETTDPVLYFTIRGFDDGGRIDYMALHEMFHIIGTSIREKTEEERREDDNQDKRMIPTLLKKYASGKRVKSGLDSLSDFLGNPYDVRFRKYERFNETITDIFAVEAMKRLHSRGIYLFEDKEITIEDETNSNTSVRLKKMLAPLVKNYRNELKTALIGDDIKELTNAIGEDNFEQINDCINRTDAIIRGEFYRGHTEEERENAIKEQEERCNRIYQNIERHRKEKSIEQGER